MFPAYGCVTAIAKPTATAASTALPPFCSTETPTSAAVLSMATTMPWRARSGCRVALSGTATIRPAARVRSRCLRIGELYVERRAPAFAITRSELRLGRPKESLCRYRGYNAAHVHTHDGCVGAFPCCCARPVDCPWPRAATASLPVCRRARRGQRDQPRRDRHSGIRHRQGLCLRQTHSHVELGG